MLLAALCLSLLGGRSTLADDGNLVDVNGVKYRETTQKQQRQVVELKEQTRTYKQTRYKPETQTVSHTVMVPITENTIQLVPISSWNPFAQPTYEWRTVPVTRWQPQVQQAQVTVMKPEVVDVQVVEQVPVARLVDVDVRTRVAVNGSTPGAAGAGLAVLRDPNAGGSVASSGANNAAVPPWQKGNVSLSEPGSPTDSTAARDALPRR
ncbi:MAG TPA: hypothetical protein VFE24_16870 [Pirellulales bacterium]|jgi:hypothetical protein|nr:hypothetical protein [Pirellulales bacterium]